MDIKRILTELRSEQEGLNKAISALEPLAEGQRGNVIQMPKAKAGRPGRRGPMSAAARKRLSELMKRRWAQRKRAKAA